MKVKGTPIEDAQEILGQPGDVELSMVMIPMTTYKVLLEISKQENCTVADVFSRAIVNYVNKKSDLGNQPVVKDKKVDFVFKKSK